jgi:hypothetical protein
MSGLNIETLKAHLYFICKVGVFKKTDSAANLNDGKSGGPLSESAARAVLVAQTGITSALLALVCEEVVRNPRIDAGDLRLRADLAGY